MPVGLWWRFTPARRAARQFRWGDAPLSSVGCSGVGDDLRLVQVLVDHAGADVGDFGALREPVDNERVQILVVSHGDVDGGHRQPQPSACGTRALAWAGTNSLQGIMLRHCARWPSLQAAGAPRAADQRGLQRLRRARSRPNLDRQIHVTAGPCRAGRRIARAVCCPGHGRRARRHPGRSSPRRSRNGRRRRLTAALPRPQALPSRPR